MQCVCVCVCNVRMLKNSYAYRSREQSCDDHTSAYECAYKIISNFKFAMKNYTNIGSDRIIWYESQLTIQAICLHSFYDIVCILARLHNISILLSKTHICLSHRMQSLKMLSELLMHDQNTGIWCACKQ